MYVDLEALGGTEAYHVGASIKDAGKRAFAVSRIEDPETVAGLLARVASLPAGYEEGRAEDAIAVGA